MKIKPCLILVLFLLGAITSVRARPMMEEGNSTSTPKKETATRNSSATAGTRAGDEHRGTSLSEALVDPENNQDSDASSEASLLLDQSEEQSRAKENKGASVQQNNSEQGAVEDENNDFVVNEISILRHGGLTNNRADCFINSSLQLCKAFREQLDQDALARMPYLTKFFNEGLSSDEECRLLREEMGLCVIKDNPDLQSAIQDGTAQTHQDAAAFLRLLLAETQAPEMFFEETLQNQTTRAKKSGHLISERVLFLHANNGGVTKMPRM